MEQWENEKEEWKQQMQQMKILQTDQKECGAQIQRDFEMINTMDNKLYRFDTLIDELMKNDALRLNNSSIPEICTNFTIVDHTQKDQNLNKDILIENQKDGYINKSGLNDNQMQVDQKKIIQEDIATIKSQIDKSHQDSVEGQNQIKESKKNSDEWSSTQCPSESIAMKKLTQLKKTVEKMMVLDASTRKTYLGLLQQRTTQYDNCSMQLNQSIANCSFLAQQIASEKKLKEYEGDETNRDICLNVLSSTAKQFQEGWLLSSQAQQDQDLELSRLKIKTAHITNRISDVESGIVALQRIAQSLNPSSVAQFLAKAKKAMFVVSLTIFDLIIFQICLPVESRFFTSVTVLAWISLSYYSFLKEFYLFFTLFTSNSFIGIIFLWKPNLALRFSWDSNTITVT